jgi:aryl-alcohol dehydrogenase-like predicted oxidoreductase
MAIAFAASRLFATSAIIGATTMVQLETDIASLDLALEDHMLADIEQIHLDYPNPCP